MHPFTANDVRPLIPTGVAVGLLCFAATVLAARRDSGAGTFATRDVRPPRGFGLRSPFGLAGRLDLPVLSAWCAGAAAAGLVLGVIAKMTSQSVPASLTDTLVKFGVHGSFASQYFSVAFLLVATLVALLPASQIGAACEEELSGRLVNLLAGPVRKATWLGGRLLLAGIGILAAGLLAGVASWVGAATQGVDIGSHDDASRWCQRHAHRPCHARDRRLGALAGATGGCRHGLRRGHLVHVGHLSSAHWSQACNRSTVCPCSTTWRWRPRSSPCRRLSQSPRR